MRKKTYNHPRATGGRIESAEYGPEWSFFRTRLNTRRLAWQSLRAHFGDRVARQAWNLALKLSNSRSS